MKLKGGPLWWPVTSLLHTVSYINDCLVQVIQSRSDSIWNTFTNTILWRASKITGRKGGFSLPVQLFVDISFIFWKASPRGPAPPFTGMYMGPAHQEVDEIWFDFFKLSGHRIIPTVTLLCHLGLLQDLWVVLRKSCGCWHRQIGITVTAFVSSWNFFLFFFYVA